MGLYLINFNKQNINLNFVIFISIIFQSIFTYSYEIFGYIGPWLSLLSLFFIVKKHNSIQLLGLKWGIYDLYLFISTTFLVFSFLFLSIKNICFFIFYYYLNLDILIYIIGQTLTEEIIFGYLFIEKIRAINKLKIQFIIIICFALIFPILHQILYTNPFRYKHEELSIISFFSLFIFGFIRIIGYIIFLNISLSWAIHLGWNLVFLPTYFINNSNIEISEPQKFNLIFSQIEIFIFILLIFLFSIYTYFKSKLYLKCQHL
ncbi:hypothetical protein AXG55_01995 [Silvanigrella aquatica]|uniref:CAAX prenyl protease 2/Lysostaphin resistance protein A-like domain-containing protein n=1 Tax=Silvanigrella aquatica TaxID=1915309 RepID=A0A1L4CXU4_9BACT|nr:hypothetical protein AXG55_01995 [Silvanigrella aquatica]